MKANLIEMLKAQGFSEVESKSETIQQCNGVILQRDWSREVEVAFHGSYLETFAVRVFVNRNSGICHVSYQKDGREYPLYSSTQARLIFPTTLSLLWLKSRHPMSFSRVRSTAPGLWSRISTPNHRVTGCSEEKDRMNFRSLPSPSIRCSVP